MDNTIIMLDVNIESECEGTSEGNYANSQNVSVFFFPVLSGPN